MRIGNFPKQGELPIESKRYWQLSIGVGAVPSRCFDGGWRAFEFVVLKKYAKQELSAAHPYSFRLAFAFWLPFYSL